MWGEEKLRSPKGLSGSRPSALIEIAELKSLPAFIKKKNFLFQETKRLLGKENIAPKSTLEKKIF